MFKSGTCLIDFKPVPAVFMSRKSIAKLIASRTRNRVQVQQKSNFGNTRHEENILFIHLSPRY
jgi:hypothetical protein